MVFFHRHPHAHHPSRRATASDAPYEHDDLHPHSDTIDLTLDGYDHAHGLWHEASDHHDPISHDEEAQP